jgi:hypothetical protein
VVQEPVTHLRLAAVIGYVTDQFPALPEQFFFVILPVFDCRNPAQLVEDTPQGQP